MRFGIKAIAPSLSIELSLAGVRTPDEFTAAFSEITRAKAQALYVVEDPIFFAHRIALLKLASSARLVVADPNDTRALELVSLNGSTPGERSGQPPPSPAVLARYAWRHHCGGLFQMPIVV